MADDKRGRDKQAHDAERRQQEREMTAAVERGDEREPPVEAAALADFEGELDDLSFPATGAEVVAALGAYPVESVTGTYSVADLVPETDEEAFDSPAAVRVQVQRPTVAAAMTRVLEASAALHAEFGWTQRKAYEKTFRELDAVGADGGIEAVTDWLVGELRDDEALPTSRAVRREAAAFCRANGLTVRDDEWLGV